MPTHEWEERDFLILVKSYPNPSASLQEVVCVAAMRDDGVFVRLFPIPFRTLQESNRFKKWQWIRAKVTKANDDRRPESFKVDVSSIRAGEIMDSGKGWPDRWQRIRHLVSPSWETLEEQRKKNGTSLGLIRPSAVKALEIEDEDKPDWTADEQAKLAGAPGATDLFGSAPPSHLLEKLPVRFRYVYSCDGICGPHRQLFIDWEVGQSWRSWRTTYRPREKLENAIRHKYLEEPRGNLLLFLGTVHRFPDVWMVIGQIRPPLEVLNRG